MNILTKVAGSIVCALAVATAVPACAAPIMQTFTGNVVAGSDDTAGLFGGGNLGGDAVTLTFNYSLTNGASRGKYPGFDDITGGSYNGNGPGAPNAILSVVASINGMTQVISSLTFYNDVFICAASNCGTAYTESTAQDGAGNNVTADLNTGPLRANLALAQSSAGTDDGSFFDFDGDAFKLNLTNVSFGTSVPEPATLAALGTGLLALGMMRRRRS